MLHERTESSWWKLVEDVNQKVILKCQVKYFSLLSCVSWRDRFEITRLPQGQWRTRRGGPPPQLKNSGQTLFSGKAQVVQKFWKIKNISIQWKTSGQILFFRTSAGCSKFWKIKTIYSIQWIQGTLFFRASTSCSKVLNVKAILNTVKNFMTKSVFRASAKFLKNPER